MAVIQLLGSRGDDKKQVKKYKKGSDYGGGRRVGEGGGVTAETVFRQIWTQFLNRK